MVFFVKKPMVDQFDDQWSCIMGYKVIIPLNFIKASATVSYKKVFNFLLFLFV